MQPEDRVVEARPPRGRLWLGLACVALTLCQVGTALGQQVSGSSRHGVTFRVPDGLVALPTPSLSMPHAEQIDAVYRDGAGSLQLWVVSSPGPASVAPGEDPGKAYSIGFVQGARALGRELAADPAAVFDEDSGSYALRSQLKLPSLARTLLHEPPTHAVWSAVRDTGESEALLRCFLQQLLAGAADATPEQLRERAGPAAVSCGASDQRVRRFIALAGDANFAARVTTLVALAIPTRSGTVAFYAFGPRERAAEVSAVIAAVKASLAVPESQRMAADAAGARLFGIATGALLAVLCFGGLGAWLLTRARGWPVRRALLWTLCGLNLLNAAFLLVPLTIGVESWLKVAGYLFGSLLLYAPMAAWLEGRRRGAGLLSDQRGLSTLEYAVLFAVLVIAALALWSKLGASAGQQVGDGADTLDSVLKAASRGGSSDPLAPGSASQPPGLAWAPPSAASQPLAAAAPKPTPTAASSRPASAASSPSAAATSSNSTAASSSPSAAATSSPSTAASASPSAAATSSPSTAASSSPSGAAIPAPSAAVPQAGPPANASAGATGAQPPGLWDRARDYVQNTPAAQYTLGLGAGILQGFTPGGFVVPSPYASSKPFELGRGLGQMAAGISETVAGVGMMGGGGAMTGGGLVAAVTPASPAGVGLVAVGVPTMAAGAVTAANGVAATASGYGTFINAMSMSDAAAGGGSSSGGGSSGGGGDPRPAPEIASELLKSNNGSVTKALPQLQRMNLGQSKSIEVLQQMYKSSGRDSFVQAYTDGAKVLLSRRIGPNQPILVISKTGQVTPATATIEVTGVLNPPMRAVDIVF